MMTIAVLNWAIAVFAGFFNALTSPVHDLIVSFAQTLNVLYIPVIIYDSISLAILFLPIGTVLSLLSITLCLIAIQIVHSAVRFLFHFFGLV